MIQQLKYVRKDIWRDYALFSITFFLVITLLTAFYVIPKLNKVPEKQQQNNLKLELNLEIELFMRFIQAHKIKLSDFARFPSIANAVMLADTNDSNLIEFFDNIVIEGKKGVLVLQDISGEILLQTHDNLKGSYKPNTPWQEDLLSAKIDYYFQLIGQKNNNFTFQLSVPVLYKENIEGIMSAEITVPKSQAFATPAHDTGVAIRLTQGNVKIQTSLENIETAHEISKNLGQPNLTFTYITDKKFIAEQKNNTKNIILSVLLIGFIISFILFGLLGYLSLREKHNEAPSTKNSWMSYILPCLVGIIGLAATVTAYFIYHNTEQKIHNNHLNDDIETKIQLLKTNIDQGFEILNATKSYIEVSQTINDDDFQKFITPLLEKHSYIQTLKWLPTPSDKEVYNPTNNKQRYLLSDDHTKQAAIMNAARDNKSKKSMLTFNNAEGEKQALHLLVFDPVYNSSEKTSPHINKQKNIKGFVALKIDPKELISQLSLNHQSHIPLRITDVTNPQEPTLIFNNSTPKQEIFYNKNLKIEDRQWEIQSFVNTDNVTNWARIFILGAGIGLSSLVTIGLIGAARRRQTLEDTVQKRTAELKQSETEIKNSKNFLELVLNNSPSFIFVKDKDLKIVQANQKFLNLYPEDERDKVIGYTTAEKYNKEEAEGFFKYDKIAFEKGYSDVTETINFPDGSKLTLYTQKVRFENPQKEEFIIGIANDVTEYEDELSLLGAMQRITISKANFDEKMQQVLKAGCEYFNLPLGIISRIDGDNYIVKHTADPESIEPETVFELGDTYCAITFQQSEPFYANNFSHSQHKNHPFFSKFGLETYIGTKIKVFDFEYGTINFSSPDKRNKNFSKRQTAMLTLISQWIGLKIAEHKSLQDKNKLIDKLVGSNEELERFAFICSHDLQEPLRMIRSFSELLQKHIGESLENDEKGKKYFNFITDGAARAQTLIEDILTYSSIDSDTQILDEINIEHLIKFIDKNANFQSNNKITHDALPSITGNKTQILQLFQNLINNGLKYQTSDKTPHIHISVKDDGKHWQFCVKDNGIGMEERHQKKIFDVFVRLHRKSDFAGTGIGLAICKKIVERHGGNIWVESQKGEGSKFYFTILKSKIMEERHGNKTS